MGQEGDEQDAQDADAGRHDETDAGGEQAVILVALRPCPVGDDAGQDEAQGHQQKV